MFSATPFHILLLALVLAGVFPSLSQGGGATRLMMDLSDQPDEVQLSAFNVAVVRGDARLNLETQQALGTRVLARLNLAEVAVDSPEAEAARSVGLPLTEMTEAGFAKLDATHPNWIPLVVREIVQNAAEKGFDGFVLKGLTTLAQGAGRGACITVIQELDRVYPDKTIVIEDGLNLVPEVRLHLDAVLLAGSGSEAMDRDEAIRQVRRLGIPPWVVEHYPAQTFRQQMIARGEHLLALGAVPCLTTAAMNGLYLGPMREVVRRIQVLHSGPAEKTWTAQILQGTLQWLGYQVTYQDLAHTGHTDWNAWQDQTQGVILDSTLQGQPGLQTLLLPLAEKLGARQVPLLLGCAPWGNAEEFARWAAVLGLRGSGLSRMASPSPVVRIMEVGWLQNSGQVQARTAGFRDLQAPAGAKVLASVKAGPVFDQVFLASWGGMWLDPLAPEAGPQFQPLPFLKHWLAQGALQEIAPVMDVASQGGRRLLVPLVDSTGFAAPTSLPGLPLAVEAMTEEVLQHYALPFTIAVCENDVRALSPGLDAQEAPRYQTAARALFALPHVHAASASRSRPADWAATEEMEREVAGSLAWIHRHLLPPGGKVDMMLWPEGSVLTTDAVVFSRRMNVENVQVRRPAWLPGRQGPTQPAFQGRRDTFQAFAPTSRRAGQLHAASFISQTSVENETRWMSPLHLPLSFQDVENSEALDETRRVLDWCASQPFQAMSSAQHARLVRDAAATRLFQQSPRHWILVNDGYARTLRLPAEEGLPDMERSTGIAGYSVRGGDLYVHTLGRRRTELILSPQGSPAHLRLAGSSSGIRHLESGQQRALFQVMDLRPVELAFAGMPAGAVCQVLANDQPQLITADKTGRVEVTVPARTTVRVQVMPELPQAAMR